MAQYIVKRGDTLGKIAARISGMTGGAVASYVAALASINNIANINKIYPGQVINYPDEWAAIEGEVIRPASGGTASGGAGKSASGGAVYYPPQAGRPGGTLQTMLQNPMILGAIAIGLFAFFSMRNK